MQAPTALYPAEMGGLIDALATYNNDPTVPGYSVYYYAQNSREHQLLTWLLSDDGCQVVTDAGYVGIG